MKIFAAFPSKYLKPADLQDKHVTAEMDYVLMEEVENRDGQVEMKPVLYFKGQRRGLILNVTNSKTIANLYGDETDAWKGMPIVLFSAMVDAWGETVASIRMKRPSSASMIRAFKESPFGEELADRMHEDRESYEGQAKPPAELTPENLERAKEVFAKRNTKNTLTPPKPRPTPINEVIWDEAEERAPTEEETLELQNSMLRANAALETRRVLRSVPNTTPSKFGRPSLADIIAAR